jgi:cytochrome c oxidase subunit III
MAKHFHPFHLVDPSPWPFIGAFGALGLTSGGVLYMHSYALGSILPVVSLLLVLAVMAV